MPKNILLIGGTGFIGKQVVNKLLGADYAIRILTRKKLSNTTQIEYVQGDLLDLDSLSKALNGIDVIIQAAQFPGHPVERPWLGKQYTYEGLDGEGTDNVCEAIKNTGLQKQIKQFIYVSGAGAGDAGDFSWLRAKRKAETAVQETGIPFTILRPSWIYGQGDKSMSKFILFAKYLPVFPVIGDGTAPVNPVWVEDVAQIIVNCLDNPAAQNQIIEVGSKELSMSEVCQIVLEEVGVKKPLLLHPKPLMKFMGLFAQFIPESPLSPNSVEFLTMDVHLHKQADQVLGVQIHSLKEGLHKSGMLSKTKH
jgi:uncharacterized protein YbjT (DUF2867 family)